jgi:dihydrofolate reductase
MGRRTWASLPPAMRPLPGRLNLVLSTAAAAARAPAAASPATAAVQLLLPSLPAALAAAGADPTVESVFVIGGAAVYAAALAHPQCRRVYMTRVYSAAACDTWFPALNPARFTCATPDAPRQQEGAAGPAFQFLRFDRID